MPSQDGCLVYWYLDSSYSISTSSSEIEVGEGILDQHPQCTRGFVSFDLSTLKTDTIHFRLTNATLGIYQTHSVGNGHTGIFPVFNGLPGRYPCILDHINYGDTLDWLDWGAGDPGNPETICSSIGSISSTPDLGYKLRDVTDHVLEDFRAGRRYSQFRLHFRIDHDADSLQNYLLFVAAAAGPGNIYAPFLELERDSIISAVNYSVKPAPAFTVHQNYPNPFNNETRITFNAPGSMNVSFSVYNVLGGLVRKQTIWSSTQGTYFFRWDGRGQAGEELASGVYLGQISCGDQRRYLKMLLVK